MLSKSAAQARFMAACAHGAKLSKPYPPRKVSQEYNRADQQRRAPQGQRKR